MNTRSLQNRPSILEAPLAKCYQLVWNIIDEWVDSDDRTRTPMPSPRSDTEVAALNYVSIERIVAANHSGAAHPIVDDDQTASNKVDAMVRAASTRDVIEVRKVEDTNWSSATKLECGNWFVVDGKDGFKVPPESLLGKAWVINVKLEKEDDRDNKVRQSKFRKAKEADRIVTRLAKLAGQEERDKVIQKKFNDFNSLPSEDRTFAKFKGEILDFVKHPSDHTITVTLDGQEHVMDTCIHEQGSAAMKQLVTRTILEQLVAAATHRAKSSKRRKGKVGKVRKGSDGFRKSFQIDEQHLEDINGEADDQNHKKETFKKKLLARYKAGKAFMKGISKKKVWKTNGSLDTTKVNGTQAAEIIKFFGIKKCSGMLADEKIKKVKEMHYSKSSFAAMRNELEALLAENEISIEELGDTVDDIGKTFLKIVLRIIGISNLFLLHQKMMII